jgi:hypothetical protein
MQALHFQSVADFVRLESIDDFSPLPKAASGNGWRQYRLPCIRSSVFFGEKFFSPQHLSETNNSSSVKGNFIADGGCHHWRRT